MNLIELVSKLNNQAQAELFAREILPNTDFGNIAVYMKSNVEPQSELFFIDFQTYSSNSFRIGEEEYHELLPLHMIIEFIEEGHSLGIVELKIAERIIEYAINDA